MARGRPLTESLPGIDSSPIYYISLHGSYIMKKYAEGSVPIEVRVPDDMLIIETSNIGESCYFVNFKEAITPLLSDRPRLLQYMSGNPPDDDTPDVQQRRAKAFSSCHIYLPGSIAPNRFLQEETGRRLGFHLETGVSRREGARASDYGKHMVFTRHDVGREPVRVLEPVHRRLIEESYGSHDPKSMRANAWLDEDTYETYQSMFSHISKQGIPGLKIVIFPVCGTIVPTNPKAGVQVDREAIEHIYGLQTAADFNWSQLIGKSLTDLSKYINTVDHGPIGVEAGRQFVGRNKYPISGPVPKRGGSRRFVKKSKKTRKNKFHRTRRTL